MIVGFVGLRKGNCGNVIGEMEKYCSCFENSKIL